MTTTNAPVINITLRNQKLTRCWHCIKLLSETEPIAVMQISLHSVLMAQVLTCPPCFDLASAAVKKLAIKHNPSPIRMVA